MPHRQSSRASAPRDERELRAFVAIIGEALGFPPYDPEWVDRYDSADVRLVRRNREVAAGLWLLRFGQWFGGARVPMVGIHAVGVAPEHRGSGVGSALMRAVVEELFEQGVPISTLFPATQPIYRRVGYEHAGSWIHYRMPIHMIDVRDRELEVRRLDGGEDGGMRALYERRARATNGNLDRNEWAWQRVFQIGRGTAATRSDAFAVHGRSGAEGYVVFTRTRASNQTVRYDLRLRDLVALTPAAARRILALIADHRSLARDVVWVGPPADPLQLHMREQCDDVDARGSVPWLMRWMVRMVDARKALAVRGYPPGVRARVDFDIRDDLLAANAGKLVLEVDDGQARVRRGGRGSLRIDVRGLAALYTGYLTPAALARAGLADGADDVLARAAPVFAGPSPWLAELF